MEHKNGWRTHGLDYICTINGQDNSIVIRYYSRTDGKPYSVSQYSFFPFTNEQCAQRFEKPEDCVMFAQNVVKEWVASLFTINETLELNAGIKQLTGNDSITVETIIKNIPSV